MQVRDLFSLVRLSCGMGCDRQVGLHRDNHGAHPVRHHPSVGEPAQVDAEAKCKVPSACIFYPFCLLDVLVYVWIKIYAASKCK